MGQAHWPGSLPGSTSFGTRLLRLVSCISLSGFYGKSGFDLKDSGHAFKRHEKTLNRKSRLKEQTDPPLACDSLLNWYPQLHISGNHIFRVRPKVEQRNTKWRRLFFVVDHLDFFVFLFCIVAFILRFKTCPVFACYRLSQY